MNVYIDFTLHNELFPYYGILYNKIVALAVTSQSDYLITSNIRDFKKAELKFDQLNIITPGEFVKMWRDNSNRRIYRKKSVKRVMQEAYKIHGLKKQKWDFIFFAWIFVILKINRYILIYLRRP